LSPASPRLSSIDVFRGATIVAMILVNGQFSHEESYRQLAHAAWNGWTFADTIFPCFLFIVGVLLTLSTASRVARGEDHTRLLAHAVRRSLLIFGCGVVIDYLRVPIREFPFVGFQAHLQLTGALQRIAVCYLMAFHIYLWGGLRGVIGGIIGLNLLYLGLLYFYPVPGCGPGSLAVSCNFVGYLDEVESCYGTRPALVPDDDLAADDGRGGKRQREQRTPRQETFHRAPPKVGAFGVLLPCRHRIEAAAGSRAFWLRSID